MGYCLAEWHDWPTNIIVPEVVDLVRTLRETPGDGQEPLRLHRYFHHGLSSQALLFNLVGPLVVTNDLDPLRDALAGAGVAWPGGHVEVVFEYSDRSIFSERQGQPTSIDLVLLGEESAPLALECKFTEPGFGGCAVFEWGDCDGANPFHSQSPCYLEGIGRGYLETMRAHGLIDGPIAADSICPLATNYQFFRELLFALACGGELVLMSDRRSPVFAYEDSSGGPRGRMNYLRSILPTEIWTRVHHVHIQDVVDAVEASGRHPWVGEFRSKYGMQR